MLASAGDFLSCSILDSNLSNACFPGGCLLGCLTSSIATLCLYIKQETLAQNNKADILFVCLPASGIVSPSSKDRMMMVIALCK